MADLVNLTVSVPADRVADMYAFVASLHAPTTPEGSPKGADAGPDSVRRAYFGGASDYWRPFLDYLADRPGEWVAWTDLCQAIGLTPRQASGMLGAAERRCQGHLPYEKGGYREGDHRFRMAGPVATLVKGFAAK